VAFSTKLLDEVNKKIFNRIDYVYAFLEMYAITDADKTLSKGKFSPEEIDARLAQISHPLDLWILARLNGTLDQVTKYLELYILDKGTRPIADFIDDLSTWYVRRSRDRFKSDDVADRESAMFTTRFVLERLSRIMAPAAPFSSDDIYQKVRFGDIQSVHLESWPEMIAMSNTTIGADMKAVRDIVEKGLALRAEAKIKARQPLAFFTYDGQFTHDKKRLPAELEEIVKDELNVKDIKFGDVVELDTVITPELREEGAVRDLIRAIQQERKNQNLNPQDRIMLIVACVPATWEIINRHADVIASDAGVESMTRSEGDDPEYKDIPLEFLGETVYLFIIMGANTK
jgi:isoleucyl-tRNA synthetase